MFKIKKKLLFVCSGGIDRSPTAESLFKDNLKFEARFYGLYPLTESSPLTRESLRWADLIFVMEHKHKSDILERFPVIVKDKLEIIVLNIPNNYIRHDPELEKLLRVKLAEFLCKK
tara:strand:+ start:667 stop:1014 length:348 start_codon:yes stop_codon:yes gene_type:complete